MYFGQDCFSIFTACCYLCDAGGKLINENVTVISEASDHSRIAAFSCINTVFQFVCEKDNLPLKVILHILDLLPSAGSIMSAIMEKVPCMVSEVRSKTESFETWCLKNVEELSNYASTVVNGIFSVYLPQNDLLTELDDSEEALKIPETLSIHKVVRGFNEHGICHFKFYFLSNNSEPFFTHYYRKENDAEDCDHELLPLLFDADETCTFCRGKHDCKLEWLQCSIC